MDHRLEFLLERLQPFFAGEGLVVAEEGENHVGLGAVEPVVGTAEVGRAQPLVEIGVVGEAAHLVGGKAEVAEHEVLLGKATVEERFQPAVVLHAVGQRVADVANMIALAEFQRRRGGRGGRGTGEHEDHAGEGDGQRRQAGAPETLREDAHTIGLGRCSAMFVTGGVGSTRTGRARGAGCLISTSIRKESSAASVWLPAGAGARVNSS